MSFKDVRQKGFHKRIKLKEAINLGAKSFDNIESEIINIQQYPIINRILRENVISKRDIPPFERSAVDGYAVRAEDTYGASEDSPVKLLIIEEIEIGKVPLKELVPNTVTHIPTGGVIPKGANAVIMIENTKRITEREILVFSVIHPKKNIANKGEDFEEKDLLFKKGHKFRSIDKPYLLASGNNKVLISKNPRIGITVIGDELIEPTQRIEIGKVPEINSYSIYDLCESEGWNPEILNIIKDNEISLKELIKNNINNYDILIISGGTSVGKKDIVPIVLNNLGTIIFHGLAIRPGGPVICAKVNEKPVFGLPGFPTATIISFLFVIKPIIYNYLGFSGELSKYKIPARISRNVGSKLGTLDFLRVNLVRDSNNDFLAIPIQVSGSGRLSNIVKSDGIVRIEENMEGLKEGEQVEVELIF